jgi:predicted nucleotidyltransferase
MAIIDEALLNEMTNRLVHAFHPEKVILFGSHAWGTPDKGSDIDLFVIVPESHERPLQRIRRARACLEDVRVAKDILVRTRVEVDKYCQVYASLECQVLEKGRVLYDRP